MRHPFVALGGLRRYYLLKVYKYIKKRADGSATCSLYRTKNQVLISVAVNVPSLIVMVILPSAGIVPVALKV